ncbi:DUF305 domain-containing protein [Salinibacterium sp. TMP30]|uniref:DUF305 domain-containing protein n=1 Tax=Salinibacterium sp. TMP30 TaxID=3138237 RepID=UPI003138B75A
MNIRVAATTAMALTALLALTGCTAAMTQTGQSPASGPTDSVLVTDANNADVMFTVMMIPHHEQAVEMADMLIAKNGVDDQVLALAEDIKAAQGPEITLMSGWLDDWGIDSESGMAGMNHGDGMMTDTDMSDLESATGDEASRLFLEQMIVHHEGAIDMALVEAEGGQNTEVLALAQQIIDAQTAEITVMRDILSTL